MRKLAAILLGSLVLACAACRGGEDASKSGRTNSANAGGAASRNAAASDPAKLDAEIARLERVTERNPADDEARTELARAYLRRAQTHRGAGRLREALADYRRAQLADLDNEEALKNIAELSPQVEGTPPEGEYGEPAPPPISPNVTEGEGKETPEKK